MSNRLKGPDGRFLPKPKAEELAPLEKNEDGDEVVSVVSVSLVDPLEKEISL
jgi:hypothetical protein